MSLKIFISIGLVLTFFACQETPLKHKVDNPSEQIQQWHNKSRSLRYRPDGMDIVINNGTLRFNRALYGSHTGFRVETGDLPEFALYMPGLGGTLRLGLAAGDSSKWLIDAAQIETRYRAGTMRYTISDPILRNGNINISVLALSDAEGMILKIQSQQINATDLIWGFGGATGKRFNRDGDLGADPESSFYLKPENCIDNEFVISDNQFTLYFGSGRSRSQNERYENNYLPTSEELEKTRLKNKQQIYGVVPPTSQPDISDAGQQDSPHEFYQSERSDTPVITGKLDLSMEDVYYLLLLNPDSKEKPVYSELAELFTKAESAAKKLAARITVDTPDPYINAMAANLTTAADAVWDGQSFMHGSIAWRMPLNGWRGAYVADWLGWHDRAQTHFSGYFAAQYTEPALGTSMPDPKTHFARQKEEIGSAMFTSGYISRNPGKINKPHHYDMNLVFIDQLLSHFRWTGDLDFLKKSWPVLERHLAWEKRNFDGNNDGLYDAYCCIWASDALQYSGGGVTHSSAYNYSAFKMAAELAPLIGKDPHAYQAEAEKIKAAVDENLWLPQKGWFAENKDLLGNQLVHPSAALWTVYHAIDEGIADPFQAYQTTKYVDHSIPHIPIEAEGLPSGEYYTLSTTNWMPYNWSINNVAFAEVMHTALAYWQANRKEEAFKLAKGVFLDYMFLGSSPANFGQLSFYDAYRGELYRDFSDPIGLASRALVEGIFGVVPDLINKTVSVKPGWPSQWEYASLHTPDISIDYKQIGLKDQYQIQLNFPLEANLKLKLQARKSEIKSVKINGVKTNWTLDRDAIDFPLIVINTEAGTNFSIDVIWKGDNIEKPTINPFYAQSDYFTFKLKNARINGVYDPQAIFDSLKYNEGDLKSKLKGEYGHRTAFVKLQQGEMQWYQPLSFEIRKPLELIVPDLQAKDSLHFSILNNTSEKDLATIQLKNFKTEIFLNSKSESSQITIPTEFLLPGSNEVIVEFGSYRYRTTVVNWDITTPDGEYETVSLSEVFNDQVTNIFNEQYLSPRSPYPTLSLPVQGIGDWCSYSEHEEIDDAGLRSIAGTANQVVLPPGIPFASPGEKSKNNILFTSQWDNYPVAQKINLEGSASHVYLLMAGSGHHMQSRFVNGKVTVEYVDGTNTELELKSPENWWPIEQDFYQDGFAFQIGAVQPPRLYLKSGEWHFNSTNELKVNSTIKIEGGAASVLDMPLDLEKELKSLSLETIANDVVIGLMGVTLVRNSLDEK